MSATLADDVKTSPGAGLRCKGTKKNVYVHIDTDFFRKNRYTLVYIRNFM